MDDKIKRFTFYNIFFLCVFISLFLVLNLKSFARPSLQIVVREKTWEGDGYNSLPQYHVIYVSDYNNPVSYNYCFYHVYDGDTRLNYLVCDSKYNPVVKVQSVDFNGNTGYFSDPLSEVLNTSYGSVRVYPTFNYMAMRNPKNLDSVVFDGLAFDNLNDAANYVLNGVVPELPFDETLKLDSFKITSWQIGTSQLMFRSKFEVKWSDERISNVQVRIVGTANSPTTFESNLSPFKQKFYASNYVMKNGDVIHFTATPYKANGEYGESLYYSIVYEDGLPSNWYRKLVNTPYNDNTLTIPYNNVSGQPQSVTLPVDGVTTQNVYKVNYNPVTNEYGDLNLYNIYYSPVVIYPGDAPEEEIDQTQDVVNNTYTTNNYYQTTKNFNINFDVSFGDISGSDIQIGYDNTGNFLNSFGKLISKLSTWVLALFPFLPPIVATSIVVVFGLVVSVAIIVFALKIASVIADFIDAIIPG